MAKTPTKPPAKKPATQGSPKAAGVAAVANAIIAVLAVGTHFVPHAKVQPPHTVPIAAPGGGGAPTPLLAVGQPVDWWFAYKFSSGEFKDAADDPGRSCAFGGVLAKGPFSLQYAVASSADPNLTDGPGLIGQGGGDPLGATFGQIYSGKYYFVVWNDQLYGDPRRTSPGCSGKDNNCDSPWGHSKGMLAWDLLQVTTPSWPGAGGFAHPRKDGNTLGCVSNDNNVGNAQDFFALKLTRDDVKAVLKALAVASVSTDANDPQIVNKVVAGQPLPQDLADLVAGLGHVSKDKAFIDQTLSSGVRMLVKPSALHVPPWQFVSSRLDGEPLLTATWWASPQIPSTRSIKDVHCWDASLPKPPGEVDVALKSNWEGVTTSFTGGPNHAKIGVSLPSGAHHYAIFGDLNQQGALGDAARPNDKKDCDSAQNGRGGMFFVTDNPTLHAGVAKLITGTPAPFAGS